MEKLIFGNPDHIITQYDPNVHSQQLKIFCNACDKLGWENNNSFNALKLDKLKPPYGQYWIALEKSSNTIFSIAGVQYLPEIHESAWRLLFRGAQLPGYTPRAGINLWKSGIQFSYFINEQVLWTKSNYFEPEFFITTNSDNKKAGKSTKMGKIMMPRLCRLGYFQLYKSNIELYSTLQDIWKLHTEKYFNDRALFLAD